PWHPRRGAHGLLQRMHRPGTPRRIPGGRRHALRSLRRKAVFGQRQGGRVRRRPGDVEGNSRHARRDQGNPDQVDREKGSGSVGVGEKTTRGRGDAGTRGLKREARELRVSLAKWLCNEVSLASLIPTFERRAALETSDRPATGPRSESAEPARLPEEPHRVGSRGRKPPRRTASPRPCRPTREWVDTVVPRSARSPARCPPAPAGTA